MAEYTAGVAKVEIRPNLAGFARRLRAELERITATFGVEILPDFDQFREQVKAELAEYAESLSITVDADTSKARRKINRITGKKNLTLNVDADTGAAESQLDTTARDRKTEIEADADTAAAETQLDITARNRESEINADADTGAAESQLDTTARDRKTEIEADADTSAASAKLAALVRRRVAEIVARTNIGRAAAQLAGLAVRRTTEIAVRVSRAGLAAAQAQIASITAHARAASAAMAGLAAQGIGLGVIGVAATGAVGPLAAMTQVLVTASGALATLPALAGAAAGALAALGIGVSGVGKAFSAMGKGAAAATTDTDKSMKAAQRQVENAERGIATAQRRVEDAHRGVADAARKVDDAHRGVADAARRVEDAERKVADAERSVVEAQKNSRKAQQDLNQARKDAARDLQDMKQQLQDAALNEEDAVLAVARAKQRLREAQEDPESSRLDIAEADLAYRKSLRSLDEMREKNNKLAHDTQAASDKGVEGSDKVVAAKEKVAEAAEKEADAQRGVEDAHRGVEDAQRGVEDAQRRVEDAYRGVEDAQRNLADAQDGVVQAQEQLVDALDNYAEAGEKAAGGTDDFADALANLSPNAQAFVLAIQALSAQWKELRLEVQDNLFAGLGESITDLATAQLPILRVGLAGIAAEINSGLRSTIAALASESSQVGLDRMLGNTAGMFANVNQAARPLTQALVDIGAAGSAYLPQLGQYLGEAGTRLADFLSQSTQNGQFDQWVQNGVEALKTLGHTLSNIGGIISGVFHAASAAGQASLGPLGQLLEMVNNFVNSMEGQQALTTFFGAMTDSLAALMPILSTALQTIGGTIMPAIAEFIQAAAPGIQVLVQGLADGLAAFAPAMAPIGEVIGQLGAALGPLVAVLGQGLADALIPVAQAFGQLLDALSPLLPVLGEAFNAVLVSVAQVLLQVAEALAPVITALVTQLTPIIEQLTPVFTQLAQVMGDALVQMIQQLAPLLPSLVEVFAQIAQAVVPLISMMIEQLSPVLAMIMPVLVQVAQILGEAILNALNQLAPVFPTLVQAFGSLLEAVLPLIPMLLQLAVDVITPLIPAVIALVPAVVSIVEGFVSLLEAVAPLIPILAELLVECITPLIPMIISLVPAVVGIVDAFVSVVQAVVPVIAILDEFIGILLQVLATVIGVVGDIIAKFITLGVDVVATVVEFGAGIVGGFADMIQQVIHAIVDFASDLIQKFNELWAGAANATSKGINSLMEWVRGIKDSILDAFHNAGSWLVQIGKDLIMGLWSGIKHMWHMLTGGDDNDDGDGPGAGYGDGGVTHYANGGTRLSTQDAQIAPGGSYLVWAEDETQGEAFIPLAPSKRKRSTQILAQTANIMGFDVVEKTTRTKVAYDGTDVTPQAPRRFADGGITIQKLDEFAHEIEGQPYGQTQWGDGPGAVSAISRYAVGLDAWSDQFSLAMEAKALSNLGFNTGRGDFGDLQVGWFGTDPDGEEGHTALTVPSGVAVEMGGERGDGQYGGAAAGADDPQFTEHAYLPGAFFTEVEVPADKDLEEIVEQQQSDSATDADRIDAVVRTKSSYDSNDDALSYSLLGSRSSSRGADSDYDYAPRDYSDPSYGGGYTGDDLSDVTDVSANDLKDFRKSSRSNPDSYGTRSKKKKSNTPSTFSEILGKFAKDFVSGQVKDALGLVGISDDIPIVKAYSQWMDTRDKASDTRGKSTYSKARDVQNAEKIAADMLSQYPGIATDKIVGADLIGGLNPKAFALGGLVTGPGGSMDDAILSTLSNGEFVVREASARHLRPWLEQINAQPQLAREVAKASSFIPATAAQGRTVEVHYHVETNNVDEGLRRADMHSKQLVMAIEGA
nr:MAG TPA: Minor tail protein [Caudoviricetes sp.]